MRDGALLDAVKALGSKLADAKPIDVGAVQVAIDKAKGLLLPQVPDAARPIVTDVADLLDTRADTVAAVGTTLVRELAQAAQAALDDGHDADAVTRAWLEAAPFAERHARVENDLDAHGAALAQRLKLRADVVALVLEALKVAGPVAVQLLVAL